MCWLINLILLVTSCHCGQAVPRVPTELDHCIFNIDWRQLWKRVDFLDVNGISDECFDVDKSRLCDPVEMNIQVVSNNKGIILPMLNGVVKIFRRKDVPFPNWRDFVEYNYLVQSEVKSCLPASLQNYPTTTMLEECFQKMEVFLNQPENSRCNWQIIQRDCMAILQQIEYYTVPSFG